MVRERIRFRHDDHGGRALACTFGHRRWRHSDHDHSRRYTSDAGTPALNITCRIHQRCGRRNRQLQQTQRQNRVLTCNMRPHRPLHHTRPNCPVAFRSPSQQPTLHIPHPSDRKLARGHPRNPAGFRQNHQGVPHDGTCRNTQKSRKFSLGRKKHT